MTTHFRWRFVAALLLALVIAHADIGVARVKPGVRIINLRELDIGTIVVHPDGTVINFPAKPEIHVGKKDGFDIAFVENDLVVSGHAFGAKTNLFIYLQGRRYTLKLLFNGTSGDQIVTVRDPRDQIVEVPMAATETNEDLVLSASDDGHRRQWGLGRFFLKWEGGKQRIKSRALFCVLAAGFGIATLVGLLRPNKAVFSERSPIDVAPMAIQQSTLPAFDVAKSNGANRKVRGASPKAAVLEVVRRHASGKTPPGILTRAKLLSGASNGFVKALLLENASFNGDVYFPAGTIVTGAAQSSKERLMVSFTKAVLEEGSTVEIHAQACDVSDKMPGLAGVNVRSQALSMVGAVGLNFAGGMAMGLQDREAQDPTKTPTLRDSLLSGAGTAALEKGKDISEDLKSQEPLIEISEGSEFYLLFLGDN